MPSSYKDDQPYNSSMRLFITSCAVLVLCAGASYAQGSANGILKADSLFFAGDFASARELYSKTLKDTSRNAGAWARYGFSCLNTKDYVAATRHLEKALRLKPAQPIRMNAHAGLSRAYAVSNDLIKCTTHLDSAARQGYVNLTLIDSNEDFANVRNDERFKAARQKVYNNAYPCMNNPKAREFDFWIGEWEVYVTGTKSLAGHSKVDMISRGCALLENWDSSGSSGKSLNFVDPNTGKWRQTWVGSYAFGIQDFVQGEYKDGAMRFAFEGINAQGKKFIGRFIFYNEKPGQVRQFNETSLDGGKTWVTSYDFTYLKKE